MDTIIEKIKNFFYGFSESPRVSEVERLVTEYLNTSTDIVDLKRKMEILRSRGIL